MNKILQGYTITRSLEKPFFVPTSIQSQILRNYCERKEYIYKLHLAEFNLKNSVIQLYQIINHSKKINGIVMCSILNLPSDVKILTKLLKKVKKKKIELHFVFENLIFKNQNINFFIKHIFKETNKVYKQFKI